MRRLAPNHRGGVEAVAAAKGYLTVLPGPYPSTAASEFAAAFTAATGRAEANKWATFAYDSVLLLAAAIAQAKKTNPSARATLESVANAARSVTVTSGITGTAYIVPGTNDRGGLTRLELQNLQGPNVTAQQDFAVVGECLCDPETESGVIAHAYHGEIVWPGEREQQRSPEYGGAGVSGGL